MLFSGLGPEEPGAGGVAGADAADAMGCHSADSGADAADASAYGGVERALLDVARKG